MDVHITHNALWAGPVLLFGRLTTDPSFLFALYEFLVNTSHGHLTFCPRVKFCRTKLPLPELSQRKIFCFGLVYFSLCVCPWFQRRFGVGSRPRTPTLRRPLARRVENRTGQTCVTSTTHTQRLPTPSTGSWPWDRCRPSFIPVSIPRRRGTPALPDGRGTWSPSLDVDSGRRAADDPCRERNQWQSFVEWSVESLAGLCRCRERKGNGSRTRWWGRDEKDSKWWERKGSVLRAPLNCGRRF